MNISRRKILVSAASIAATLTFATARAQLQRSVPASLRSRRAGYGAAVTLADLNSDPHLAEAVIRHCTQIVPVYELKWGHLRRTEADYSFDLADNLLSFAESNGLKMRGHNLVWYAVNPPWVEALGNARDAERVLVEHIETVVSRYRDRIYSWDVVNEPIPDKAQHPGDRRPCIWSRHLGARYIPLAFRTAAAADPKAQLVLNEYDIEQIGDDFASKRAAFRNLIFELLDADVPLDAIGMQCHLRGDKAVDREGTQKFVAEMRSLGLKVIVTELDVQDQYLTGAINERDAIEASCVDDILSAIANAEPLESVLTWGLSDRHSWISQMFPRSDGLPNRPLPVDSDYRPKPFMSMIEKHLRAIY